MSIEKIANKLENIKDDLLKEYHEDQVWANYFNVKAANSVMEKDEVARQKIKLEFDFMARCRLMRYTFLECDEFIKGYAFLPETTGKQMFEEFANHQSV